MDLNNLFEEEFPNKPTDMISLMNDINHKIIPSLTHWESPGIYVLYVFKKQKRIQKKKKTQKHKKTFYRFIS